jgi:AraC-like DNA-binding protein
LHYKIYYITGPIFYTLLIYALTYLFLKHSNLGLHKYKSSKIDRAASKSIFEKIMKQFLEEQMYLENNISVDNLAVKLDVNSRILSQVINENEQKSFKEFINFYRVEHAKNLLKSQSYRNEKIATIGYDSGFGTTVSFNNTFKKFTKMTPTQFRNKNS